MNRTLLAVLLAGCALPMFEEPAPNSPPPPQQPPPPAEITGDVRVFVSSKSVKPVASADSRALRAAALEKLGAPSETPAMGRAEKVVNVPPHFVPKSPRAAPLRESPIVPGDFIVGTSIPTEPDQLLTVLAPRRLGLSCGARGFASETLQLVHCVHLDGRELDDTESRTMLDRFGRPDGVAFIELNHLVKPLRVPNDTLYPLQSHYLTMSLPAAWDITVGSASTVVAVLDSGHVNHPDLAANTLPGIDLVSDVGRANDGNARDDDPMDACGHVDRRLGGTGWHGAHVAGTIAAASNNGQGVAGVAWNAKVLPVRVLGCESGSDFDIAAGITWATGGSLPGARTNTTPASVVNMSLGGDGAPSQTYQSVIDAALQRGAIIVVAAGNEDEDTANKSPCNQSNVICVAATDNRGIATAYTNYGKEVTLSAPGGALDRDDDADGEPDGVLSTVSGAYAYMQGTSMATPHVAGLVALMKSLKPQLKYADVRAALISASTPVSNCGVGACGAGLVNAAQALAAVQAIPNPEPVKLSLNVASVLLTRDQTAVTVQLTNVGGTTGQVEFVGTAPHNANVRWDAAQVPLPLGPGRTVNLRISWVGNFTSDIDIPSAFIANGQRVNFTIRIRAPRPMPKTVVALAYRDQAGDWQIEDQALAAAPSGAWTLNASSGRYLVVGLSDDDGDGEFEENEGFGIWPRVDDPVWLTLEEGRRYQGYSFAVAPLK